MKTTYDDYEQLSIVRVDGDVIADEVDQLRHGVQERLERRVRDFVLDLETVEFIDSKGLEAMVWLQETAADLLGQVRLVHVQANVNKILQLTRLASRFECHDDLDKAIKSLR